METIRNIIHFVQENPSIISVLCTTSPFALIGFLKLLSRSANEHGKLHKKYPQVLGKPGSKDHF